MAFDVAFDRSREAAAVTTRALTGAGERVADRRTTTRGPASTLNAEVVVLGSRHGVRDLVVSALGRSASFVPNFGPDRCDAAIAESARRSAVLVVDGGGPTDRETLIEAVTSARSLDVLVVVALCRRDPVAAAVWVEAGANAVVTEDTPVAELTELIDRVARGEQVIGVSIREGLLTHLRAHRQATNERAAAFASLTRRESQVLRDLAMGMTPEEVAKTSYVSLNTIRSQIRGVLAKLAVNSVVAAVAAAYRSGWMHEQIDSAR
jgi:DNA-binding NarL/FixJ family response regulator